MPSSINLDFYAAGAAQGITGIIVRQEVQKASNVENAVTKALGVLQENGPYAMTVYLLSRSGKGAGEKDEEKSCLSILYHLLQLLRQVGVSWAMKNEIPPGAINSGANKASILQHFSDKICEDFHQVFFTKTLFEQALIYARHQAKALG